MGSTGQRKPDSVRDAVVDDDLLDDGLALVSGERLPSRYDISALRELPEYYDAGLRDSDTEEYLPRLGIETVDEFLGLIRGATAETAVNFGTSEDALVSLYNAAISRHVSQQAGEEIEASLREVYAYGVELTAPESMMPAELCPDLRAEPEVSQQEASAIERPTVTLINQFMPAIRDQGKRGTCVAFSTTAVLEYIINRSSNQPADDLDLSEQYLY